MKHRGGEDVSKDSWAQMEGPLPWSPASSNKLDLIRSWSGRGGDKRFLFSQVKKLCFMHYGTESSGTGTNNTRVSLGWLRKGASTTQLLRNYLVTVLQIFPHICVLNKKGALVLCGLLASNVWTSLPSNFGRGLELCTTNIFPKSNDDLKQETF